VIHQIENITDVEDKNILGVSSDKKEIRLVVNLDHTFSVLILSQLTIQTKLVNREEFERHFSKLYKDLELWM